MKNHFIIPLVALLLISTSFMLSQESYADHLELTKIFSNGTLIEFNSGILIHENSTKFFGTAPSSADGSLILYVDGEKVGGRSGDRINPDNTWMRGLSTLGQGEHTVYLQSDNGMPEYQGTFGNCVEPCNNIEVDQQTQINQINIMLVGVQSQLDTLMTMLAVLQMDNSTAIPSPTEPPETDNNPEMPINSNMTDNVIRVSTDKESYTVGETIVISGSVSEILGDTLMTVIVKSPNGNIVLINQPVVDSNKNFNYEFAAGGSLMQLSGTYKLTVQYGSVDLTAKTTFEYVVSS